MDVVLLTEARYEAADPNDPRNRDPAWYIQNILNEDALVSAALEARGVGVTRVDWARKDFDWSKPDAAIFRTTWDYFFRVEEFSAWLDEVSGKTQLQNSAQIIRWNMDKHYLRDLQGAGVSTVPTHYLERGSESTLRAAMAELDASEVVFKPVVSGAARETYRVSADNVQEHEATARRLLAAEAMMLQPFISSILDAGELSLMVFGGQCTHAVRKVAKPGDFRVQDDFGGTVLPHTPTQTEREFAEAAVAACPNPPTYARVDVVRDGSGALCVMELELVEPELFFRFHPPAAETFADAIIAAL